MDALVINGPAKLSGKVRVSGSKNTALPLLFASILFDKDVSFENIPRLWDIETTLKLLHTMGASSHWDKERGEVIVTPTVRERVAPYEWVKRMRAGILALGPLLARYGEAKVSLPGGCAIGARPVNFHIEALQQMGAAIEVHEGYIYAKVPRRMKGAVIDFPTVSVTGTENVLYVAATAEGTTTIKNAAREPEVTFLGETLNSFGAKISGLGTNTITVQGVDKLNHPEKPIRIPADRIEAGTWIAIAAATRSELELEDAGVEMMTSVIDVFRKTGLKLDVGSKPDSLKVTPADHYHPVDVTTTPYPGFPTDMQAQLMSVLCLAEGTSRIQETIFENRFMHVAELRRLGAKIDTQGNEALIHGPAKLEGAPIMATDLRASASLVVAALASKGQSRISRIYHLDRGYQRLDQKLTALGASIQRVEE